jgi:hypothetical protein
VGDADAGGNDGDDGADGDGDVDETGAALGTVGASVVVTGELGVVGVTDGDGGGGVFADGALVVGPAVAGGNTGP